MLFDIVIVSTTPPTTVAVFSHTPSSATAVVVATADVIVVLLLLIRISVFVFVLVLEFHFQSIFGHLSRSCLSSFPQSGDFTPAF